MPDQTILNHLAILAISGRGARIAGRLHAQVGGDVFVPERFREIAGAGSQPFREGSSGATLQHWFGEYGSFVLVMPVGVAVRLLAPLVAHKETDPAVVVLDEACAHAVALLSGHVGGGNELTRLVAQATGARPVITTAAELFGTLALDLLGREWGWTIEDQSSLTQASAAMVAGEPVGVFQEAGEEDWWRDAPATVERYATAADLRCASVSARVVISDRIIPPEGLGACSVHFHPRSLVVGVGCVRGATAEEIGALLVRVLADHGLALASVRELATIDLKRDEPGLTTLAAQRGWAIRCYSPAELSDVGAPSGGSPVVEAAVGTPGVCEPAALRAAGAFTLLAPKAKTDRVTVAVARVANGSVPGRLSVVGLGPGAADDLTGRAQAALQQADAIVGYHGYLDLVRAGLPGAVLHGSDIGEEIERCRLAIELSRKGQRVALVSSGDAGIYGTAGLVFELLGEEGRAEEAERVEVIPGVSAAGAAAALLGAPLMSDFATISLSDLLTPWSVIEARLTAAAVSDLVVALYNPASQRRRQQLARAQEIFLAHRPPETPVGLVRSAARPGQAVTVSTLGGLDLDQVDMLTTVIVGNRGTIRVGNRLVTRRGYPVASRQEQT